MINFILSHFTDILQAESTFRNELEPAGITVESRKFKTTDDPIKHIKDLFVSWKQKHATWF